MCRAVDCSADAGFKDIFSESRRFPSECYAGGLAYAILPTQECLLSAKKTQGGLSQRLSVALESWPLYRRLEYKGANNTNTVPNYLSLFCHGCGKDTFWQTGFYGGENNRSGLDGKTHTCRNGGNAKTTYYFLWAWSEKGDGSFMKVGQYPPVEERVSTMLTR